MRKDCFYCGIKVNGGHVYRVNHGGDETPHYRFEYRCPCGAHGKLQDSKQAALSSFCEPWQSKADDMAAYLKENPHVAAMLSQ